MMDLYICTKGSRKMKNLISFLLCISTLILPLIATHNSKTGGQHPEVVLENTQQILFKSKNVDQTYIVQTALPLGYSNSSESFPVIFLLDSDKSFGMARDIIDWLMWSQEIEKVIVVGISYGNEDWWQSRSRDYTPWKDNKKIWGDFPQAGGADNFLKFLEYELIPFVDLNYRTKKSERAIAGLSVGGLFVSYAMIKATKLFNKYLLSGSALIWDNKHIFMIEEEYAKSHNALPIKLYSAVGELDEKENIIGPWKEFHSIIESRKYQGLEIKGEIIPGEGHISSWPIAFTKGIIYLFGRD
jgi:predicted alpha/beta superfamily hydrolase